MANPPSLTQDQTTFIRLRSPGVAPPPRNPMRNPRRLRRTAGSVQARSQIDNVYNYGVKDQLPMVREHHKGPAVQIRGEYDLDFIMGKLKTAAETAIPQRVSA